VDKGLCSRLHDEHGVRDKNSYFDSGVDAFVRRLN